MNQPRHAYQTPHPSPLAEPRYRMTDAQARNWAMYCHFSQFAIFTPIPFLSILLTLVLWLMKKDDHPFVDQQGREALNFQISILLYLIASIVLILLVIGIPLLILLLIGSIILPIIAAVNAGKGVHYRYPLIIRFF